MGFYMGMDNGGTHCRLLLGDEQGRELGRFQTGGGTINYQGYDAVRDRFAALIDSSLAQLGLQKEDLICFGGGIAGIDTPALLEKHLQMFEEMNIPRAKVRAYNDCEVLLHAFPGQNSVAAVAGTGAVVVGQDTQGNLWRCGGWGHQLSDEGSAIYYGKKIMEYAIRMLDGLDYGSTILLDLFRRDSGLTTAKEVDTYYKTHGEIKNDIARFAPLLEEAIALGDNTLSPRILREGAEILASQIVAVAQNLHYADAPFVVIPWGSVLENNRVVRAAVEEAVLARCPRAQFAALQGSAVEVALQVARLEQDPRYAK